MSRRLAVADGVYIVLEFYKRYIRVCRNLQDLDPRFREADQYQEFFQYLESQEPILSSMPLRASEFWGFLVPKRRIP